MRLRLYFIRHGLPLSNSLSEHKYSMSINHEQTVEDHNQPHDPHRHIRNFIRNFRSDFPALSG
ncbi:hypothetical protein EMIT043CA1_10442 [Pseudomonas brassicacearum]